MVKIYPNGRGARGNIELPMIYSGLPSSERRERALEALGAVGLLHRSRHRPHELSGGEQQRVAIARSLLNRPAILLADEPTGNLDSRSGEEILKLFEELHQTGSTILMVTHNPKVAERAQRIISLIDGWLVRDETLRGESP